MVRTKKSSKAKSTGRRRALATMVIAALIIVLGTGLFFWRQSTQGTKKQSATSSQADTTPRPTTSKGGNSGTQTPPPTDNTQTPPPVNPNNLPVTAPSGSFVSNHKPGQNGSPQTESSVCITTPGATCEIFFTNAGVTKSLGTQVADSSGAAYWNAWTPQGVGLTTGDWTVSATATWGQQTASTADPIVLQVRL